MLHFEKHYFVFAIVSGLIIFGVHHAVFQNYGFLDDYYLFYHHESEEQMEIFSGTGRPIYGMMMKYVGGQLYYIKDFRLARLLSMLGITIFSVLLYRSYLSNDWSKYIAGSAAVSTCLMPSFGVFASWATCFAIVYALILSFLSGEICLLSYAQVSRVNNRAKAAVLGSASISLIVLSLMIYQPVATGFWLYIAINLFKPIIKPSDVARRALFSFMLFAFSLFIYFLWFRSGLWPFAEDVFNRSGVVENPIAKIIWFIRDPLYTSLSLNNVLQNDLMVNITCVLVALVIISGISLRAKRMQNETFAFILVFLSLIPLSYLPNLLVSVNFAPFRTQAILSALIVFYLMQSLLELFKKEYMIIISTGLMLVFIVMAYQNVTYGFVKPTVKELGLIRSALIENKTVKANEIVFILSDRDDSMAAKVRYDEYGIPSTAFTWVPKYLIYYIARDSQFERYRNINIEILLNVEEARTKEESLTIDAGKLMRDYKRMPIKKEFENSQNVLLKLNHDTGFQGTRSLHQATLLFNSDGLVIKSHGNDPHISLPAIETKNMKILLKILLRSPESGTLQLFYHTVIMEKYSESRSIKERINKGLNEIYTKIDARDVSGRLRLDPGAVSGEFILHEIEVRGI